MIGVEVAVHLKEGEARREVRIEKPNAVSTGDLQVVVEILRVVLLNLAKELDRR